MTYPIYQKLKKFGRKPCQETETFLLGLSLKDLIRLKLELSAMMVGGKLYFNLWQYAERILHEAMVEYAKNDEFPHRVLGISRKKWAEIISAPEGH